MIIKIIKPEQMTKPELGWLVRLSPNTKVFRVAKVSMPYLKISRFNGEMEESDVIRLPSAVYELLPVGTAWRDRDAT